MAIPRVLFVVPGISAGLLIPSLALPHSAPAGTVGMIGTDFAGSGTVYINQGQRLTLFNSSDLVHIIGPGWDGKIYSPQPGNPVTGFHLMDSGSTLTTGPWMVAGRFRLTCTVHEDMNLTVVVVRRS
jgi:hypothetical protein